MKMFGAPQECFPGPRCGCRRAWPWDRSFSLTVSSKIINVCKHYSVYSPPSFNLLVETKTVLTDRLATIMMNATKIMHVTEINKNQSNPLKTKSLIIFFKSETRRPLSDPLDYTAECNAMTPGVIILNMINPCRVV